MVLKDFICCVLTIVVVVNAQTSPSKGVDIPPVSKSPLFPVKLTPYPRLVTTADGTQLYLTTFYNIPATYKCPVTYMNGLRVVDEKLTGLKYVILGSVSTTDLSLAQLYKDKNGTNVIYNSVTSRYESISFDANGDIVLTPYKDIGKLKAVKSKIQQYILTDDNGNQILVTLDNTNIYRFAVYNDSQTLIPYSYSHLTGQGYLIYHDLWTFRIVLYKLERDLSGNFIAQNTDTGERKFVYYNDYGELAFSSYPNYPPPKPSITSALNVQTGGVTPTTNVIY